MPLTLQRLANVFHDRELFVRIVRIRERLDERRERGRSADSLPFAAA